MSEDQIGQGAIHITTDRSQEIRGVKDLSSHTGPSASEQWDRFGKRKPKHKRAKVIQAGVKPKSEVNQDTYIGDISIED